MDGAATHAIPVAGKGLGRRKIEGGTGEEGTGQRSHREPGTNVGARREEEVRDLAQVVVRRECERRPPALNSGPARVSVNAWVRGCVRILARVSVNEGTRWRA